MINSGQSVVVIEDLVSTGSSSLSAVEALREAGANVKGLFAIFSYDLQLANQNFMQAQCEYTALLTFDDLIKQALEENYINEQDWKSLMEWKLNPQQWSDLNNEGSNNQN